MRMKVLHPEQTELYQLVYCGMFLEEITQLTTHLQTEQLQKLLKTDATTINGQEYVAEYFKVSEQWKKKKQTHYLPILSCSNSSNNIAKKTTYGYPSGKECTDM